MIAVAPLALASTAYLRRYQPYVWIVSVVPDPVGASLVSSPVPLRLARARGSVSEPPSLWPNWMRT
jgi:hypothetical protein